MGEEPASKESFWDRLRKIEQTADDRPEAVRLLRNIKTDMVRLKELLKKADGDQIGVDGIYRFYHQSWEVFALQSITQEIVEELKGLLPDHPMNSWFLQIIDEGTGRGFGETTNNRWLEEIRPILEAFFHARAMLSLAVKSGEQLEQPPQCLPSGWATVLYLYRLR